RSSSCGSERRRGMSRWNLSCRRNRAMSELDHAWLPPEPNKDIQAAAFVAVSEVARILREAVQNGQHFTFEWGVGKHNENAAAHDGSYDIHIAVAPEPSKPCAAPAPSPPSALEQAAAAYRQ